MRVTSLVITAEFLGASYLDLLMAYQALSHNIIERLNLRRQRSGRLPLDLGSVRGNQKSWLGLDSRQ